MGGDKHWDFDKTLSRLAPQSAQSFEAIAPLKDSELQVTEITDALLEEAYVTMALIVKQHGEHYLPIFERLHNEITERQKKSDLLSVALSVADQDTSKQI